MINMDIKSFKNAFNVNKVLLGMIHLKGDTDAAIFNRAKKEIDMLIGGGFDAVIIEDYYSDELMVEKVLHYIYHHRPNIGYGVNVLVDYRLSFEFANKYHAKFIQIDSVAGHLNVKGDLLFAKSMEKYRAESNALVLGGVRFKYQPILSGRSVEEDVKIGMSRCDAIVVTGEGTGMDTDLNKIKSFRKIMGDDFPLIIGAGLTPKNAKDKLVLADGGIVGSCLKDNHRADGEIYPDYVHELVKAVRLI